MSTSANTFYHARAQRVSGTSLNWQLFKFVASTATQLGSSVSQTIATSTAYNLKLNVSGTTIELYDEGGGSPTISATDSAITAAGFAGLRENGAATDSTLYHLDNFSAEEAGAGTTVSVPAGSITLTGYAPTVSNPLSIPIPAAALTLSGFAPTVTTPRIVSVPAGSLTLTGFAPVVSTPRTISVPAGSLSLTGFAPTVTVAAAGTTVSVPAGSLSLTGFAPTVSISAVIAIPPGALTLTGFAPSVNTTLGTIVDVPAGGLTLSGFAPTVYTVGDFTTSVFYLPLRAYADGMSGTVDPTTALDNLRSLLPSQRTPLSNPDSTMSSQWYRFFDYMVNQYLGGLTQPTVADIVASVEATQASVNASAEATQLIAQQAQANAESLAAVVQVTQNASIPGASQIPPVSLSYLEP